MKKTIPNNQISMLRLMSRPKFKVPIIIVLTTLIVLTPVSQKQATAEPGTVAAALLTPMLYCAAVYAAVEGGAYALECFVFHTRSFDWYDLAGHVTAGGLKGMAVFIVYVFPPSVIMYVLDCAADVPGVSGALGDILGDFFEYCVSGIRSVGDATFKNIKDSIIGNSTEFKNRFLPTLIALCSENGSDPVVPSSEPGWADFRNEIIETSNMSIATVGMQHNTNEGASWRMLYPGTSNIQATFTLSGIPTGVILSLTHLSSADAGAPGGGYSPVDIYINGHLFLDNYDVAENHGGSHGYEIDEWEIQQYLVSGQNNITIAFEDDPWAHTHYWIQSLTVTFGKLNGNEQNYAPVLSSPRCEPFSGTESTSYEFLVHYYDHDGDEPDAIYRKVYISGTGGQEEGIMTLKSGSPSCGTYGYTTTLSIGSYSYMFMFADTKGAFDFTPWYGWVRVYSDTDDIIYVNDNAPNDPVAGDPTISDPLEDGSPQHPFDSIQESINTSVDGDTVVVANGTYTGPGNHDIIFGGKAIILRSQNGADSCVIDCQNNGRGFLFENGEDQNSVLDGFTIANGNGGSYGGGIYCRGSAPTIINCVVKNCQAFWGGGIRFYSCSPTITDCIITGNSAGDRGGGIESYDSSLTIARCQVTNNSAERGGGILLFGVSDLLNLTDCIISGNSAKYYGGGVYSDGRTVIVNCLISDNSATGHWASTGGGVECWGPFTMANCTLSNNRASMPFGDGGGGALFCDSDPSEITNCIFDNNTGYAIRVNDTDERLILKYCLFWNNPDGDLSSSTGQFPGATQNLHGNPLYTEPGYWDPNGTPGDTTDDFWVDGDYRLRAGSPCIDAADGNAAPVTDILGNTRHDDLGIKNTGTGDPNYIDIGAYEFQGTSPPPKSTNPSPSNGATNQSINVDLSWSNAGGATDYDVYFGTDFDDVNEATTLTAVIYKGRQGTTSYDPCTLAYSTTYYWRIDANNTSGTTTGDVWSFTTEPPPEAATPTFSPDGGTHTSPVNVTVDCATPGVTIHYTTNGAVPTDSDTIVAPGGTVLVDHSLTLKAKAWKSGWTPSGVKSADYIITGTVATPTISPNGGTFTGSTLITLSCSTSDPRIIRYTTNGSEPNLNSTQYSSPFTVSTTCTVKARGFKDGYTDSDVASASFIIKPAPGKFGSFDDQKNVKLTLKDCNNNDVTFILTGAGYGEIDCYDCNFSSIALYDTTEKSVLTIKTKGKTETSIGDIIVNGSLKGIAAKTANLRGDITVTGSLRTLTLNNVADGHTITIGPSANPKASVLMKFDQVSNLTIDSQTPIKTLSTTEWLGGSINAPSIGNITTIGDKKRGISGDLFEVDLNLSQKPDAKIPALGKLTVKGWIDSSRILSAGNIGTVSAWAITNSSCFAGVTDTNDLNADGVLDLPDPAVDVNYVEPATIKKITVKGIKSEPYCVINSNIAAAQILSASLAYPENENDGIPFGLSANFIKTLKIKDAEGTKSWKNLDKPSDSKEFGDAKVLLY